MPVPEKIDCIDCGGTSYLLTAPPPDDDPFVPGDIVAYRCPECLDRWDLVLTEDDLTD